MTTLPSKRSVLKVLGILSIVLGAGVFVAVVSLRPSVDVRDFREIRDQWERNLYGVTRIRSVFDSSTAPSKPLSGEPLKEAEEALARRCIELADKHRDSIGGLAALYLAVARGGETESSEPAAARLRERLSNVGLDDLDRAVLEAREYSVGLEPTVVSAILDRVRESPDHPKVAQFLARITVWSCDPRGGDPSPSFSVAANSLVEDHPESPDLVNFCEMLGSGIGSPTWAVDYEPHLRKLSDANPHRQVQAAALFARASVVQSLGEARQAEATRLYSEFLDRFDGEFQYPYQGIERNLRDYALNQIDEIRDRGIGRPAPEVVGVDLEGRPIKLTDYRGKVVFLSFWATWCRPCMEYIPHEKSLAERFRDEPFAIVGVNGDDDLKTAERAVARYGITWRSFRDERADAQSISREWKLVGWPTFYLIDHEGVIRRRWIDAPPVEELSAAVELWTATAGGGGGHAR